MTDPTEELREALESFETAKEGALGATNGHMAITEQLRARKAALQEAIIAELDDKGKPVYSNQERRDAELQRRLLQEHERLVTNEAARATVKRIAQSECERAEERLKTLRVILSYRTAELHVEAERVRASTVVSEHELLAGEAQALIHGDIPYQTVRMTGTSPALGYDPDLGF